MLLPALGRARDQAREIACANNMKQIYVFGGAFQADHDAILPAWDYPHHPDGYTDACDYWYGSPWGWTYRHFGHILMDQGYMPKTNRIYQASAGTAGAYAQRAYLATKSIMGCPNGFAPKDSTEDALNEVPAGYMRRAMMMRFAGSGSNHTTLAPCAGRKFGDKYWRDCFATKDYFLTGYSINMYAGSFAFYTYLAPVSERFYKNRRWRSGTDPDKIAYIFEENGYLADNYHMETQYSHVANAWHQFGIKYAPCSRHRRYTASNVLYADGHRGWMGDNYNYLRNFPFKFR